MSPARRALHVVTAVAVLLGAAVAWTTRDDDATASPAVLVSARHFGLSDPGAAVESFAPANVPDQPTTAPLPPTTAAPIATSPPATSSSSAPSSTSPTAPTTTAPSAGPSPSTGAAALAAPPNSTWQPQLVAVLTPKTTVIYADPSPDHPVEAIYSTTEFGNTLALPVTQRGGDWLKVLLPTRPNGSEGWIRARDAQLDTRVDTIVVDRAAKSLVWTRNGTVVLEATVGIGAPSTPTPAGPYFVTDILAASAGSAYGAWVIALNGHSDAYTEFEGGDARIAIHGTNDPSSIGTAKSNGCVRTDDDTLAALRSVPVGTPVVIR